MGTTYQIAVYSVLDGNQTLVKTATGVWQVTYNGENRPVRWVRGGTVVTMDFDSMGRRMFSRETENGTEVSCSRFFYDGYLMIQQLNHDSPYVLQKEFIWDPTEPVATKPLVFRQNGMDSTYLTHDGNKNVADVIRAVPYNDSVGHYEYAPFGAVTSSVGSRAADNPFRFSSEFSDDILGLDYYNYRHYEPATGRWLSRDPIEEYAENNLYGMTRNRAYEIDCLGLSEDCSVCGSFNIQKIRFTLNPQEREFDQSDIAAEAEELLKRFKDLGLNGMSNGMGKLGRVLRLINTGGMFFDGSGNMGYSELQYKLRDFERRYLKGIYRLDGRLKYQICMCVGGKLKFVDQNDITKSEDVDFTNAYDYVQYQQAVNNAIREVRKDLLDLLTERSKKAR